jgi:uncharacterized membrane protein
MNERDQIIMCLSLLMIIVNSLLLAIFINKFFWVIVWLGIASILCLHNAREKQKKDIDKE